jgi:hypothetical protein
MDMREAVSLMTEATQQFERLFKEVKQGKSGPISQTDEPYIEVGDNGRVYDFITDKTVPGGNVHLTAQSAIDDWYSRARFTALPRSEEGISSPVEKLTLYWRIRPEIDYGYYLIEATNGMFKIPTWKVYSRFLLTEKQPLETADAAH